MIISLYIEKWGRGVYGKYIVTVLAIMVFFATVNVSKQQVVAGDSVKVNYISTISSISANNKSNNYGISKDISKNPQALHDVQTRASENLQKETPLNTLEKN